MRENMCAIPTAKVGAPPARPNIVFSPRSAASCFIPCSVTGNPAALIFATTSVGAPLVLMAKYSPGCKTQAAIIAIKRDHHFRDHRAVTDVANARLAFDHFRRRPGRDQRMKAGNRAAGDRDANERKHRPGKDGSSTIDEARKRRHEKRWSKTDDCDRQRRDGAQVSKMCSR